MKHCLLIIQRALFGFCLFFVLPRAFEIRGRPLPENFQDLDGLAVSYGLMLYSLTGAVTYFLLGSLLHLRLHREGFFAVFCVDFTLSILFAVGLALAGSFLTVSKSDA